MVVKYIYIYIFYNYVSVGLLRMDESCSYLLSGVHLMCWSSDVNLINRRLMAEEVEASLVDPF